MKLVPLGTNGFFPSHDRHTSCYLLFLQDPERAIVLDAGTGMARLLQPEIRAALSRVEELHILLSHYHLDHTCGLFYLTGVWPGKKAIVYAPTHPMVDCDGRKALVCLLGPPLYPLTLADLPVDVIPVSGGQVEVAGVPVRFRPQRHPGGSVGIRIGDVLTYVTDTVTDPGTAEFARGSLVLLHEVWLTDEEAGVVVEADGVPAREKHSWAGAVAEIATLAGVQHLAPIHHSPWRSSEEVKSLVKSLSVKTSAHVLELIEGTEYEIQSSRENDRRTEIANSATRNTIKNNT